MRVRILLFGKDTGNLNHIPVPRLPTPALPFLSVVFFSSPSYLHTHVPAAFVRSYSWAILLSILSCLTLSAHPVDMGSCLVSLGPRFL